MRVNFKLATLPDWTVERLRLVVIETEPLSPRFSHAVEDALTDELIRRLKVRAGERTEPEPMLVPLMDRREIRWACCQLLPITAELERLAAEEAARDPQLAAGYRLTAGFCLALGLALAQLDQALKRTEAGPAPS